VLCSAEIPGKKQTWSRIGHIKKFNFNPLETIFEMSKQIEYFTCELIHETDAAYLVDECGTEIWIPKSQIEDEDITVGNGIEYLNFGIPEWLALEKGMI
jgi:hypothetical protein